MQILEMPDAKVEHLAKDKFELSLGGRMSFCGKWLKLGDWVKLEKLSDRTLPILKPN